MTFRRKFRDRISFLKNTCVFKNIYTSHKKVIKMNILKDQINKRKRKNYIQRIGFAIHIIKKAPIFGIYKKSFNK